jgi:glyoxalase family protein
MEYNVLGLHHITAIAGNARRNYQFYTQVLGLRFIKKTVNFDDPGTYHFYFGDEVGTPGTILTFFPWEGIAKGKQGTAMATDIAYSVPEGSLEFWWERLKKNNVAVRGSGQRLGEEYLSFEDPDGLPLSLVIPSSTDERKPWVAGEVKENVATRGFHSISLSLRSVSQTARVITDIFGYSLSKQEGNRYRYMTSAIRTAAVIDLVEVPEHPRGINAGGTIHHVAFRVENEDVLMHYRKKVSDFGLTITPKIDRNYFFSLYFREPGGVLFELATDNPGFSVDEPVAQLGTHLKLPPQYESNRAEIEKALPSLT